MFKFFTKPAKKSAKQSARAFMVEHADLLGNIAWQMKHVIRLDSHSIDSDIRFRKIENRLDCIERAGGFKEVEI
ncbi:MAG: hypothetical protein CVV51_09585 [Spirochaetae bacterium HGW-Spirochaetae-7]|jgi:hypothetical protein|nr:MAG: hypothetical protein CVV51_09585 [Spirochaetae bacterium HGW-Spirochaetae-7]